MDKKVGVSILFSFLVLVGLIGVTNAIVNSSDSSTAMIRSVNVSLYGDGYDIENSTRGGSVETVNLTVTHGAGSNITNITIVFQGGANANYSFLSWVSANDSNIINGCHVAAAGECDAGDNSTFVVDTTVMAGNNAEWGCYNVSVSELRCANTSAVSALGGANSTIIIRFNVTAASNQEDREIFNVSGVADNTTGLDAGLLTAYVDGRGPQLVALNISDGNTTYINGTFNGSVAKGYGSILNYGSPLTVRATVFEQNPDGNAMMLLYNGSDTHVLAHLLNQNNSAVAPTISMGPLTYANESGGGGNAFTHTIMYTWTIPAESIEAFGSSNNTLEFVIDANDTYNQPNMLNDSSATSGSNAAVPYSIILNDTLPYVYNISFSDLNGNRLIGGEQGDGTNDYLAATNITVTIGVSGALRPTSVTNANISTIYLYYNTTGVMTSQTNGNLLNFDRQINLTEANVTTIHENQSSLDPLAVVTSYQTSIDLIGNDTNNVNVYVVLGNATESSGAEVGNLAANRTVMSLFKFQVDGSTPAATLSIPNSKGISTSDSIEYTCTGSDGVSGIGKYAWYLKKPGELAFTEISSEVSSSGTNVKIFSGSDISNPGTYTVRCRVTDAVGNYKDADSTSTNDFTVSVSSRSGGGSSSGGGSAAVSFDVDFTDSPKATLKAAQGRIKSFSFDGATKHTITFDEVTATSVKLTIASNPVIVNLAVGQSKEVDVNADGVNDIGVTLNSITNNVADITVEKIEAGAEAIKREEREARGLPPTEEGDVSPVASSSMAWLWWTLLVIAVIVVIGYVVNKRK